MSDFRTSQVFAVNLTIGAVLWTNSDIREPQGIVSYGGEYVLVTKQSQMTNLRILHVNTVQCKETLCVFFYHILIMLNPLQS